MIAALKYFVTEAVDQPVARAPLDGPVDADDRRRALRARRVPGRRPPTSSARGARWSAAAELSVYLQDDVSRPTARRCRTRSAGRSARGEVRDGVARTRRSRASAATFPDLAPAARRRRRNPFPASLEARLAEASDGSAAVDALAARLSGACPASADVRYDRRWLRTPAADRRRSCGGRARCWRGPHPGRRPHGQQRRPARAVARRDEIEIMELVGAPGGVHPRALRVRGDPAGRARRRRRARRARPGDGGRARAARRGGVRPRRRRQHRRPSVLDGGARAGGWHGRGAASARCWPPGALLEAEPCGTRVCSGRGSKRSPLTGFRSPSLD